MTSSLYYAFKLTYQICPIFLNNGIANNMPGGVLPLITITQAADFAAGLLAGGLDLDLDSYFGHFEPMPNASLISQQFGMYPFANQTTAANAVITQPLAVSLLMKCPVRDPAGYPAKLAVLTALKASLDQHNLLGGTYTVATPSYFYTNCLLQDLVDVSNGETKQTQVSWRWDFIKPLLTLADAQQSQNNLMSKITNGTQIQGNPSYSGLSPTVGTPPSLAVPSVIPNASSAGGGGVSGPGPQ